MNRRKFEKYLNSVMQELDINERIELLDKMKVSWIPSIREKQLKGYSFCKECYQYYLRSKEEVIKKKEIREICTYHSSFYWDDRVAQVEQLITYKVCPICGHEKEVNSITIDTLKEYGRGENKK